MSRNLCRLDTIVLMQLDLPEAQVAQPGRTPDPLRRDEDSARAESS